MPKLSFGGGLLVRGEARSLTPCKLRVYGLDLLVLDESGIISISSRDPGDYLHHCEDYTLVFEDF